MSDIRQSKGWEKYFNVMGWKSVRTKKGHLLLFRPFFGTSLAKAARLSVLNTQDLKEIDEICKENKAVFIKLEMSFEQDLSILADYGYFKSDYFLAPSHVRVIDLEKSEESLWKDLDKGRRYGVRKARTEGSYVEFYVNPTSGLLEKFYVLERATSKKNHFYVQPVTDLYLRRDLFKEKCILALGYTSEGVVCGGKLFLCHEDSVLFLKGGMSPESRDEWTGYLLMWEIIPYFKKLGYKKLDLDGIYDKRFARQTAGWKGFSDFKEKFGGYTIEYPMPYIKYFNPILSFIFRHFPGGL